MCKDRCTMRWLISHSMVYSFLSLCFRVLTLQRFKTLKPDGEPGNLENPGISWFWGKRASLRLSASCLRAGVKHPLNCWNNLNSEILIRGVVENFIFKWNFLILIERYLEVSFKIIKNTWKFGGKIVKFYQLRKLRTLLEFCNFTYALNSWVLTFSKTRFRTLN